MNWEAVAVTQARVMKAFSKVRAGEVEEGLGWGDIVAWQEGRRRSS